MAQLFQSIQVGPFRVKNRIVFAATGTGYAHHNGSFSDQNLCHYVARAKGGAGWITIEHGFVNYRYSKQGRILAYDQESFTVGLRDLVEAIHFSGALAVVQLSLGVGRQSTSRRTGSELVSASPIIHDPQAVRRAIEEGKVDMISLSRQLLADPEWPNKVREGREKEIRRCKKCNYCVSVLWKGYGIRCAVNPELGHERFIPKYWPPVQPIEEKQGT